MHTTTSRTVLLGVGAGVIAGIATCATIAAVDTWRLDEQIPELLARVVMTPRERAELDAARRALDEQTALRRRQREQRETQRRNQFRPDLLTGPRIGLTDMSLSRLINEIQHARLHSQQAWTPDATTGRRDYASLTHWRNHLDALRSEFDRRRYNPAPGQRLSRIDRLRWSAAYSAINAYDDPDLFDPAPTTPTQN